MYSISVRDPEAVPPFTESSLNRLANSTGNRRPSDAAVINEIVTIGYPASARAFARLSDAYRGLGRLDEARLAARQGLDRIDRDSALSAEQRDGLRIRMQTRATPHSRPDPAPATGAVTVLRERHHLDLPSAINSMTLTSQPESVPTR